MERFSTIPVSKIHIVRTMTQPMLRYIPHILLLVALFSSDYDMKAFTVEYMTIKVDVNRIFTHMFASPTPVTV